MTRVRQIPGDWYHGVIPENVVCGPGSHIDSSYNLVGFRSQKDPGLTLGAWSAVFGAAQLIVGPDGEVTFGPYSGITGTLICAKSIEIGAHCMMAWASVVTDCWPAADTSLEERRAAIRLSCGSPLRPVPLPAKAESVVLEDSVWIGFGAVVLPGVRVGQGSIVGARTVVGEDVPPYSIVAGSPPRIVGKLAHTDTPAARQAALAKADAKATSKTDP
jgi:acetyltransferase-like isoleucine patch superfamily enzyme